MNAQGRRPVVSQVYCNIAHRGGGLDVQGGQSGDLEIEHTPLVDFVHHGAFGPSQPIGPSVEAGGQNGDLPDSRGGRLSQKGIEVLRADGHSVGHEFDLRLAVEDVQKVLHPDRSHQRFGQLVVDQPGAGRQCPRRRHGRRGGTHPGRKVPGITLAT